MSHKKEIILFRSPSERQPAKNQSRKQLQNKRINRNQRIKEGIFPKTNPNKLIITTNIEGNEFIKNELDWEIFDAPFEVKQVGEELIKEVNQTIYVLWKNKMSKSNQVILLTHNSILTAIFGVSLVVISLFTLLSSLQINSETLSTQLLFGIIFIWLIGFITLISMSMMQFHSSDYSNTVITEGKIILSRYNQLILDQKYIFKCNPQLTWISLMSKEQGSFNVNFSKN